MQCDCFIIACHYCCYFQMPNDCSCSRWPVCFLLALIVCLDKYKCNYLYTGRHNYLGTGRESTGSNRVQYSAPTSCCQPPHVLDHLLLFLSLPFLVGAIRRLHLQSLHEPDHHTISIPTGSVVPKIPMTHPRARCGNSLPPLCPNRLDLLATIFAYPSALPITCCRY